LIATLSTSASAPVIIGQRLRKGACGSPRDTKRMAADALATAHRLLGPNRPILVRADSAFYGADLVHAARTGGADVSITVRLDSSVKKAIADIPADAWTTITYPNPILDQATGAWISRAEVAEIGYTAFSSKKTTKRVTGRLVVRRIQDPPMWSDPRQIYIAKPETPHSARSPPPSTAGHERRSAGRPRPRLSTSS